MKGLHEKIDRLKTTDEQNKEVLQSFEDVLTTNIEHSLDDVQKYSVQHGNFHSKITEQLGKFCTVSFVKTLILWFDVVTYVQLCFFYQFSFQILFINI